MSYNEKKGFFLSKVENMKKEGTDHNTLSPAGRAQIHYRLQLQHGLECEESFWAGVLVQGSKPHIAARTHFPFTLRIVLDCNVAQASLEEKFKG